MQVLKEEIRCSILDTAKIMFLNNGFRNTSMKEISDKVGISKGNLYNYFKNKEEIFYCITSSAYTQLELFVDRFIDTNFNLSANALSDEMLSGVQNLLKERDGLLLILNCAEGTAYENTIDDVIDQLAKKLTNQVLCHPKYSLIARVIANHLITGLIEVFQHCQTDEEMLANTRVLAKYHENGLKTLS